MYIYIYIYIYILFRRDGIAVGDDFLILPDRKPFSHHLNGARGVV